MRTNLVFFSLLIGIYTQRITLFFRTQTIMASHSGFGDIRPATQLQEFHDMQGNAMSPDASLFAFIFWGVRVAVRDVKGDMVFELAGGKVDGLLWSPKSDRLIVERPKETAELFAISKVSKDKKDKKDEKDDKDEYVSTSIRMIPASCRNPVATRNWFLWSPWSPDSSKFIGWNEQNDYLIFDKDGICQCTIRLGRRTRATVEWSLDGNLLLFRFPDWLGIYTSRDGHRIGEIEGNNITIKGAGWAPDSRRVAIMIRDGVLSALKLVLWDITDNSLHEVAVNVTSHQRAVFEGFHWSPDSSSLAAGFEKCVDIYDIQQSELKVTIDTRLDLARWSRDSSRLINIMNRGGANDPAIVRTYDTDGNTTREIFLQGMGAAYALSTCGRFVFGRSHNDVTSYGCVSYVGEWNDRTHHMFGRDFKRVIFLLMSIRAMMEAAPVVHAGSRALSLPRLPMEVWLLVFQQVFYATR